ncbi:MarR family winged helix-turn-helix transcriptional regulator [Mycobacterium sp.]|uniref:MarR family winged helix-turn-helix transcriptional regulator n=1 Tax=Mycobacterium sp. TaxID=1785 RepID=UPI003D14FB1F
MQQRSRTERFATTLRGQCLGMRVARLHRVINAIFDDTLAPLGISVSQLEVLSTLVVAGQPLKPAQLADLCAVERSTMSRNVALLERKGWITTTSRSTDGRALAVTVSTEGRHMLNRAEQAWSTAQATARDTLGNDAAAILDTWLQH